MPEAPTPAPAQSGGDFGRVCLEALKALGKTLGQMTLYKIGHPAVAATLEIAEQQLSQALSQAGGEIAFSIDQDKWLANGRVVAGVGQAPSVLQAFYTRFKIGSLTFKPGVTQAELAAFCELAGMRADNPQAADPRAFLAGKNVVNVAFDDTVYAKVSASTQQPVAATPPPAAAAAPGAAGVIDPQAAAAPEPVPEFKTLDEALRLLVNRSVRDPGAQAMVLDKVMNLLAEDIQKRVEQVAKTLVEERNAAKNEATRTQNVVQNMMEGVVVVDNQGKILMMNPAAEEVYGASLADAAGKHLSAKAGEEHVLTLAAEIDTPKDREIKKDVSVTGIEDTVKTIKSAAAVVQNEEGKVVGVVASLPDVAKHKALQKMQRDFVAHITHELRAPLSSIRAALEILQGMAEGKQDDGSRMLDTAIKNSDRLADMINSILDFSKLESGQMQVFPKQTDPEKIAREAVESLAPWASKKRLNLSLSVLPGLPTVSADQKRTVQVIINLLSNAIKFTPVGGSITVKVNPGSSTGGEKSVEYAVTDTGPGIPKAEQKRVFEKFVQIAAGEMHAGGTGLGLSIAKALVHLQGGKMWLESDEGKGATFLFTLPVYVAPREAALAAPPPAPALPWWKKLLGLK
jgi:PAS domain S-box-containing protein